MLIIGYFLLKSKSKTDTITKPAGLPSISDTDVTVTGVVKSTTAGATIGAGYGGLPGAILGGIGGFIAGLNPFSESYWEKLHVAFLKQGWKKSDNDFTKNLREKIKPYLKHTKISDGKLYYCLFHPKDNSIIYLQFFTHKAIIGYPSFLKIHDNDYYYGVYDTNPEPNYTKMYTLFSDSFIDYKIIFDKWVKDGKQKIPFSSYPYNTWKEY